MPRFPEMTEEALILQAHRLRLRALQGMASDAALAHEYEVELRDRLTQPLVDAVPASARSGAFISPSCVEGRDSRLPPKTPPNTGIDDVAPNTDAAADAMTEAIGKLLRSLRDLLDMDIALVAEFVDGRRIFRHVDENPKERSKLQVGQSAPLEGTYCQRVIDGRLPAMIPNTAALPEAQGLAATRSLGIGAYLSAPVVLADGEVYGTLCCISHQARSSLGCLQVDALRSVAALVSAEIQKHRRELSRP